VRFRLPSSDVGEIMKRVQFAVMAFVVVLTFVFGISSRSSEAANQNVGYVHPVPFGSAPGSDPTADKPQSKLWYTIEGNAATWWAVMFNSNVGQWRIHKLTWPSQWVDTGVQVDDRATSRADVLWDNNTKKLYIVSLVRLSSSNQSRLYRYTYSGGTYTLDSGYPVVVMKTDSSTPNPVTGSAETMAFDKDSTGRLWITFTQNKKVWVNSNPDDGQNWGKPFVLPNSSAIGSDDISSLVAYNDKNGPSIGVLWSNHTSTSADSMMNFSYHKDSDPPNTWQPIESIYGGKGTGTCLADDHINLKSLQADPSGALFAAVKTSAGDSSSCTGGTDLIRLVVRNPTNNTWKWAAFGGTADKHTRPIVLLDTTNRKVYMFATSPTSCGVIYMKSSNMDNPSFSAGKGTPFISSSTYTCINNATSTKQTVNALTGLVVMASDQNKQYYLHNVQSLGTAPTPTSTPTVTKTPTATSTPTNTPTSDPATSPTATSTPTNTPAATNTPTNTPAATNTPTNTPTVTSTPTTPPSGGTRIKDITFENGSLTGTTGFDSVTPAGSVILETAAPIKGSDSARTRADTAGYLNVGYTGVDELYVSFYIVVKALPSSSARIAVITNSSTNGTTSLGSIILTNAGILQLRNGSTTIGSTSSAQAIALDTIYRIGIHQKTGSGNGVLEAYLAAGDNPFTTPFFSSSTQTISLQANGLRLGATNSNILDIIMDDVRLDNAVMP